MMNETEIVIPKETTIQEQTGTLLTSIPKEFHEITGTVKGAKLQWKLKQNEKQQYYMVCWIKKED